MRDQTYSRPQPPDVSVEEVAKTVDQQLASLDPLRAAAVAGLHKVRIARADSYAREKERLTLKYGADHPRLTALAGKIRFNDGLTRDLKFEAVRARIDVSAVDKNSFVFQGFVRNCAGEPKPGLTVALYDAKGGWIRAMGYGCTDEEGCFRMQGSGFSDPTGAAAAVATIRVFDKQTLLVTDAKPLTITPGKSEYRMIIVCDDGTCPPPPGDTDEPPPPPATVPNVVGKKESTAKAELKKTGFTAGSSTLGARTKQVGTVLEQKPEGGTLAALGSEVAIVVGIAEPRLEVPDVVGQTLRDAKTILENTGLVTGKIDPANAPVQNKVVKQSPAAGAEAERGTAVDLVIEVPVETVKVPAVVKLSFGEAKKAIAASGLVVDKIDPAGSSDQAIVIAQKPPADTLVKPGSAVDLSLEEDRGQSEVPDLAGKLLNEAKKILDGARLKIGRLEPAGATGKFVVVKQSPKPKTKVPEATAVDLALQPSSPGLTKDTPPAKKRRSKPRKKRVG